MQSYRFNMILVIVIVMLCVDLFKGHGRLRIPPQRSSLWRERLSNLVNTDDNEINCGGYHIQHYINKGNCGICGDSSNASVPEHQPPGKYAQGIISRCYEPGTTWIDVKVDITANHLGYFQFKLCPNNNVKVAVKQDCLDANILKIKDQNNVYHGEVFSLRWDMKAVYLKLRLPDGVACSQCVLQWTYTTGNNWGCMGGQCGLGYGSQETFINCADIAISNDCPSNPIAKPFATDLNENQIKTKDTSAKKCVAVGIWALKYYDVISRWCQVNCDYVCPPDYCSCS